MRICFFAKPDAPQTRCMVAGMAARGCDVQVIYRGPGDVPMARYAPFAIPSRSVRHPRGWAARKRAYLESFLHDFDVVSIQFLHSWGFSPEQMRQPGFCVRPWGSDICPPPGGVQPGADTVARRKTMLREAGSVAVTCQTFRDAVAHFAEIDKDRIDCLPLGVDLEQFKPPETKPHETLVGFFKGFGYAYGAPHFVRAMPRILRVMPRTRFVMIGDGPLETKCQQMAAELEVNDAIHWEGRVAHERIPQHIRQWSVSVIPSVRESFGVAALESSAVGLPVVASRVGGLQETVRDGETGLLVTPEDPQALADAVIRLLRDEELRRTLGKNGRRYIETHFNERDTLEAWYQYYERIAQRCPVSA